MAGRTALVLALSALVFACTPTPIRAPAPPPVSLPASLEVRVGRQVVSVPLEEYVIASALSEVSPVGESDAVIARVFEVQTVLARTYATTHLHRHGADGFDLCDTTHCQLYQPDRLRTSRFAAAARAAAERTAGMVVVYGAQPVEALFHSDCGGETTAADAVWGGTPVPYLIPRVDDVPATAHRHWEYVTTAEKVRLALNADRRSEIGRRLTAIEVLTRDASGRAATIAVRGERSKTLRGDDLRAILSAAFGARSIQSTLLTITKKGSNYVFDGTGFGHGVGLCQRGAMARARAGQSITEIIRAYFTGADLVRSQ